MGLILQPALISLHQDLKLEIKDHHITKIALGDKTLILSDVDLSIKIYMIII